MHKEQFAVLTALEKRGKLPQNDLAKITGLPLDTCSAVLDELQNCGWVKDGSVTEKGLEALEPYRVKRAIFIAAGMGSRMMPITLSCPKPLVRVNGVRIIDTLIDACIAAGVEEIIVVRGYLGECFN